MPRKTPRWHMLTTGEIYTKLGADHSSRDNPALARRRAVAQLNRLGYNVALKAVCHEANRVRSPHGRKPGTHDHLETRASSSIPNGSMTCDYLASTRSHIRRLRRIGLYLRHQRGR